MMGTVLGTGNGDEERNVPCLYMACRFIEKIRTNSFKGEKIYGER